MWHAINWLCAFCVTLFFQYNYGILYGRNYINSCFKPRDVGKYNYGIQTEGNLLQSYKDLFRPIFRHQHSTLIKYPLVQQTDNVDFNYFNKHLSAREKKFEPFPQYDFRIGNQDPYHPTKFLVPDYKVLINPFYSRMPSKIGESQHFTNNFGYTLSNRRPASEPEMKLKGTRESQFYCYGVKKRKPIHKKKKNENDKLIYPHKAVGGLLLPSRIILDNFSSWKWKNKKEIQANNLSMSMVYDLLLPKPTSRKTFKNTDVFCHTTKKRKIYICDESSEYQCVSPISSYFFSTERLMRLNKKTQLNVFIHQEETSPECWQNGLTSPGEFKEHNRTKGWNMEIKNDRFSTCVPVCGCRTKKEDQMTTFDSFTTSLKVTTAVPIIFKFEDYLCECYSSASNIQLSNKRRKFNGSKGKRKKTKRKRKEKTKLLKNKVTEIDVKINNDNNNSQGDKDDLLNKNDDLKIAKYIIISNDGVLEPDEEESFNYDFGNVTSFNSDSFDINECPTEISRIKRRTYKCKSKCNCKRKRAFVPIHSYHHYLLRKPSANLFSSSIAYYSKNRNFKVRKKNKHKKNLFEKKIKKKVDKGLNLGVSYGETTLKQKPKLIGVNIDNEKSKINKKREFIGESQLGNITNPCDDFEESMSTPASSTNSIKATIQMTNTENLTLSTFSTSNTKNLSYSTFENPSLILSKATRLVSTDKSTGFDIQMVEKSSEIISTEIPADEGPKFRPDTGNLHPAKLKCEQQYGRECVCSVSKVLQEINNLISNYQEPKFILNQLTRYNCTHYKPLEINYKMSPELKPRLISNKHKELLADEKNGPKEIIDETFQELMIRDVPNEETDFYIFPSTDVEIPCFINSDVQLSPNTADSASYVWRQGDNKIITGGRVIEDLNHRGMLKITEATIADSENYTCTVNYTNPDTGQTISDSFVHSVMVVTLPKFALHTLLHYTAKVKCDQETLEMFELYLPQQVEDYICFMEPDRKKICTVEIHNPICHPKNNENVDLKSVWKFRGNGIRPHAVASKEMDENVMELSLNFELDIADVTQTIISAANKTRCGPFCHLKIILKVVNILRESFTIVLPHPVSSSAGVIFQPDVNSINMKILIACEGGFKLVQGFCMPCPANTFSEEGSTECSKCQSGTYQPNIGSRTCETCPHPFRSGCSSLWFSPTVIAVTILIILFTVLMSTALVYSCKLFIARCMSPCISPCLIRLFRKKKRIKQETFPRKILKRKIRRFSPRGRKEDTTEPPTPPAEDFTS